MKTDYTEIDWPKVADTYNDECGTGYQSRTLAKIWRDRKCSAIAQKLDTIIGRGGYTVLSVRKIQKIIQVKASRAEIRNAIALHKILKPFIEG